MLIVTTAPETFADAVAGAGLEARVSYVPALPNGAVAGVTTALVDGGEQGVNEGALAAVRALAQAGAHVSLAVAEPTLAAALRGAAAGAADVQPRPPSAAALAEVARGQAPSGAPFAPAAVPWLTPESGLVEVYRSAAHLAGTEVPLLLRGERGTGKEFLARAIHGVSLRAAGPWTVVHCGTLSEALLDSELFGHERAAVPEAYGQRTGRLAKAEGGTVLLDELHRLPLRLQAKLLRTLTEAAVLPAGGDVPVRVDVRVMAAVDEDPAVLVREQRLLPELGDLFAGGVLHLPPLRARGDAAIRLLAEHFVDVAAAAHRRRRPTLSPDALEVILRQAWPGNVRQLRGVLERAVVECGGGALAAEHLPAELYATGARAGAADSLLLEDMERRHIARVLDMADGHYGRAAELLGIHRNTLRRKLKTYGLHA